MAFFGASVAVSADKAIMGSDGAAYVFGRSGGIWTERGAAYVFTLKATNGDPCSTASECASGYCIDGVCCATECGGGNPDDCQACSIAGGGLVDGTRGPRLEASVCDDDDECTTVDTCWAGACIGAAPVTCSALDECHDAGTCNPTDGVCSAPEKGDGTACTNGTCQGGVCEQVDAGVPGPEAHSALVQPELSGAEAVEQRHPLHGRGHGQLRAASWRDSSRLVDAEHSTE